jgi:hypothetical protein
MSSCFRNSINATPRRGIALLVTIVLLAFLVIIMVAMSSMVRVETQIAANQDTVAQARQNALMGLNVALAKIQETAGQDKRVTARADMFENQPAIINAGRHYQMNLTSVWDTSGGAPRLVTWLVNGNEDIEDQKPNIAPDSAPVSGTQRKSNADVLILDASDDDVPAAEFGDHQPNDPLFDDNVPPANTFDPTTAVAGGSSAPDFSFGDGHVYLVANGSVDVSKSRLNGRLGAEAYKHASDERVILRKTPIVIDGSKLKGKAAGNSVTVGHYAYWVGDAGIKASLSASNWWGEIGYNDTAGDGADYSGAANVANVGYVNRKMLNGLQLQGLRYDMLFRPDRELYDSGTDSLSDIFDGQRVPTFMNLNQNNRERRSFYFMASHPANWDLFKNLTSLAQLHSLNEDAVFSSPSVGGITAPPRLDQRDQDEDMHLITDARLRQAFHDVTPVNFSVLTDMVNGGLRKDLSAEAAAGKPSGISTLGGTLQAGVEAYTDSWRATAARSVPGNAAADLLQRRLIANSSLPQFTAAADAAYPIVPVITELEMVNSLVSNGGAIEVQVALEVELWNPYNAELRVADDLVLKFSLSHTTNAGQIQNYDVALPGAADSSAYSARQTLNVGWPRVLATSGTSWKPGEIKKVTVASFSLPARDHGGAEITGFSATKELRFTQIDQPLLDVELGYGLGATYVKISEYDDIEFPTVSNPATNTSLYYSFQSRNYDTESGVGGGAFWPEYDPRGPSLTTNAVRNHNTDDKLANAIQNSGGTYFDSTGTLFKVGQQVVLFDVPRQEVLSVASLRHVVHASGASIYRIGMHKKPAAAAFQAVAPGGLAGGDTTNSLFETHFFSSVPVTNGTSWSPSSGAKLANTSMVFSDPVPNGLTPDSILLRDASPPPNTELTGLQTLNSAQYLLVKDTLNINSTSVAAWRAFLAGALPTLADPAAGGDHGAPYNAQTGSYKFDYVWLPTGGGGGPSYDPDNSPEDADMRANWRYFSGAGVAKQPVRNAFFRFPHTAADLSPLTGSTNYATMVADLKPAAAAAAREKAAFRIGLRELTRGQVEELAWWVVYYIKNRPSGVAAPFKSLTEFIDEGILQLAINSVGNTAVALPTGVDFPAYWPREKTTPEPINLNNGSAFLPINSPAYLTQGDILELVGHRLFARSDTFVIRVYGDVNDPDGKGPGNPKILSRVWLEATVQRTPVKHPTADNADDNMQDTGSSIAKGNFGRQFRIISLRWLRPEEI